MARRELMAALLVAGTLSASCAVIGGLGDYKEVACVGACDGSGTDSGTSDGAAPSDGGGGPDAPAPDGGANPDGSVNGFCASAGPHTLCDDFDTSVDAGWTNSEVSQGGVVAVSTTEFLSPPGSLTATLPARAPNAAAWAFRLLNFPTTSTTVHFEGAVRGCAVGTGYAAFLSLQGWMGTSKVSGIDVGVRPTGASFETYVNVAHDGVNTGYTLGPALPTNRFTTIAIDVTLSSTATGSLKVLLDGAVKVDTTAIITDSTKAISRRAFWAGGYVDGTPACTAGIDNVIVDVK
jgi:hypothetical protein